MLLSAAKSRQGSHAKRSSSRPRTRGSCSANKSRPAPSGRASFRQLDLFLDLLLQIVTRRLRLAARCVRTRFFVSIQFVLHRVARTFCRVLLRAVVRRDGLILSLVLSALTAIGTALVGVVGIGCYPISANHFVWHVSYTPTPQSWLGETLRSASRLWHMLWHEAKRQICSFVPSFLGRLAVTGPLTISARIARR
ncbi:hypothetical protein MES4922_120055 [Mesorhizobium ventifaucium]|uniref:Uncharacterized protein n=1 Tax=Mesorhizobium ventifaucium TaxID=666020 RepID=A0ABM9DHB7_9HYPH|nr:hypothetical protein MES4922_120055 [Mesorhizobium ventifaucium]